MAERNRYVLTAAAPCHICCLTDGTVLLLAIIRGKRGVRSKVKPEKGVFPTSVLMFVSFSPPPPPFFFLIHKSFLLHIYILYIHTLITINFPKSNLFCSGKYLVSDLHIFILTHIFYHFCSSYFLLFPFRGMGSEKVPGW